MTTRVDSAGVYTELSGLSSLKRESKTQDPNNIREVAKQFESLFTRQMLKSMREANYGDSLLGSDQQSFYQGMYDDQLAIDLSKGHGLGLADMLVKQLTQAGLVPKEAGDVAKGANANGLTGAGGAAGASGGTGANGAAGTSLATGANGPAATGPSAPTTQWRPENKEAFIRDLWPAAQQAGEELGVDPKTLIAHAALESNWGRSMPRDSEGNTSFNLFGIKATDQWAGKASVNNTIEVEDGVAVTKREKFRHYDSPVDSFKDYVALLRNNPRYTEALNTGSDAKAFGAALQKGGYATDPAYAQKVASIAQNMSSSTTALKFAAARPINSVTRTL
jgi:flagellar protein FlgJ